MQGCQYFSRYKHLSFNHLNPTMHYPNPTLGAKQCDIGSNFYSLLWSILGIEFGPSNLKAYVHIKDAVPYFQPFPVLYVSTKLPLL